MPLSVKKTAGDPHNGHYDSGNEKNVSIRR